jgi:alkylated DNA repair protein alkB family protein 7
VAQPPPLAARALASSAHDAHAAAPPGVLVPGGLAVHPCFLTPHEEAAWLALAEPALARRRYERAHWDAVIYGFRETQLPLSALMACATVRATLVRAAAAAPLPRPVRLLPAAHVLDLAADGAIRHHVDSIKFSGALVAGLCLLSDAVMSLRPDVAGDGGGAGAGAGAGASADERAAWAAAAEVRVLLPRRCLYTLTGPARYGWAHALLPGPQAWGGAAGEPPGVVTKGRRVSVLLRDPPPGDCGEGVVLE